MKDFAAIDFETANNERSSVCSVGIVIVRNGEIVDTFLSSSLSRTIIITGVLRFMASVMKILTMLLYSQKSGRK